MYYKELGYKTYQDFLKSKHWELKKTQVFATQKQCFVCKTGLDLNVHHKTYSRLGDEKLTDLVILCQPCHKKVHEFHKAHKRLSLYKATQTYITKIKNPNWKPIKYKRRKNKEKKKLWYGLIQAQENEFNLRASHLKS